MGMKDPVPQYTYLIEQLKFKTPNLAYLHYINPHAKMQKAPEDESVCAAL